MRGFHDACCLLSRRNVRHDDAGGPAIKCVAYLSRRVVTNSDETRFIGSPQRGNAKIQLRTAERCVLAVDCDDVEVGQTQHFSHDRGRRLYECAHKRLAAA